MSKPASLPEWASVGADITEPLLAKKQVGNTVEQPKHDYFNWWMNLVYLWTVWLNAFESTAHTWSALQTFSSGITNTGNETISGTLLVGNALTANGGAAVVGGLTTDTLAVAGRNTLIYMSSELASGVTDSTSNIKTAYWVDIDGCVNICGTLLHSSATAWTAFTLPGGYRPAGLLLLPISTGSGTLGTISIATTGVATVASGSAFTGASFSVRFRPDQIIAP